MFFNILKSLLPSLINHELLKELPTTNYATALPQRLQALQPSEWAKPLVQGWKWRPSVGQDPTLFTQRWRCSQTAESAHSVVLSVPTPWSGSRMSTKPAQRDDLNSQGSTGNFTNWTAVELRGCPIKHPGRDEPSSGRHKSYPGSLLHEVNPVQADEQGNQIYKHLLSTEVCALLGKFCHLIYLFIKSFSPLVNNR